MAEKTGFGVADLLAGALELLLAHPVTLMVPLALLGLLTAGDGPFYGANPLSPWWFVPFVVALAVLAALIAILLIVVEVALWLTTARAALVALETKSEPTLGRAWTWVRAHLAPGVFGATVRRAWDLTDGYRAELMLALLSLILINVVASALVAWLPLVGRALSGIVGGLFGAAWAATLAVFYFRKLHAGATPPPNAATAP